MTDGVNVRGDGEYVIAAPSLHKTSNRYEWLNDLPIVRLPETLLKLLVPQPVKPVARVLFKGCVVVGVKSQLGLFCYGQF